MMDALLYGVLWWDASCLFTMGVDYYNSGAAKEAFNYYNWHEHMANIVALRQNLESTILQRDISIEVFSNNGKPVTVDETNEIVRLERRKLALEAEIIEEQQADIKEQREKNI